MGVTESVVKILTVICERRRQVGFVMLHCIFRNIDRKITKIWYNPNMEFQIGSKNG